MGGETTQDRAVRIVDRLKEGYKRDKYKRGSFTVCAMLDAFDRYRFVFHTTASRRDCYLMGYNAGMMEREDMAARSAAAQAQKAAQKAMREAQQEVTSNV